MDLTPLINKDMLKGLKVKKTQPETPLSRTLQQLNEIHKHILSLVFEGSSELQSSIEKMQSLEKEYFEELISETPGASLPPIEPPPPSQDSNIPIRTDTLTYEQQTTKKQPQPKYLPSNKVIDSCPLCPENQQLLILSTSTHVYLALAKRKQFQNYDHFFLCPVEHIPSSLALESHVLQEINNYKKCLIQMYDKADQHVVFFETYCHKNNHLCIECLSVPSKRTGDFPFYFKQALSTCEGQQNSNRSIIEIRKQKGGLPKQIPRNFRYFYIDFCLGYGYAHVIEDERNWNKDFAIEVIASLLRMEKHEVLTTEEYGKEETQRRVGTFGEKWREYDWTSML